MDSYWRGIGKGSGACAKACGQWDGQAPAFLAKVSCSSLPKQRTPSSYTSSRKNCDRDNFVCLPGVNLSTAVILKSLHFREHSSPTSSPVPNIRHCTHALLASQFPIQLWKQTKKLGPQCVRTSTAHSNLCFTAASDLNLLHLLYSTGAARWYHPIPS